MRLYSIYSLPAQGSVGTSGMAQIAAEMTWKEPRTVVVIGGAPLHPQLGNSHLNLAREILDTETTQVSWGWQDRPCNDCAARAGLASRLSRQPSCTPPGHAPSVQTTLYLPNRFPNHDGVECREPRQALLVAAPG